MPHIHYLHDHLLRQPVTVCVAGVGGNGGHVLECLARLHIAMVELGHPYGLEVVAYDPDTVSPANIGRQKFFPSDIGESKSVVLCERINLAYGFSWEAYPTAYVPDAASPHHILISCVDSRRARASFHRAIKRGRGPSDYYLDLGNEESIGNFVLGEAREIRGGDCPRLPIVAELFPQLLSRAGVKANTPSCSVAISLQSQGLFINDIVARTAMNTLYRLFARGHLSYHGGLINLDTLRVNPIAVDPDVWARFGYVPAKASKRGARRHRALNA